MFDWKPVTIPARHINGIITRHLFGADDDILQDFIQRGADMNIPVGIRRPIMQNEGLAAFG